MAKKILVINPFGIGDVLFSTPLIKNLRYYYPDAFIAVAVQEKVAPILENNPHINKIILFSRGDFKVLSRQSKPKAVKLLLKTLYEIFRIKFDLCIDLSLEHRYSLFLKALNIKPRIGYNYKRRGRFLTHRIDISGYKDKHVVEYHLELLKFLGIKPESNKTEIFLTPDENSWAEGFLKEYNVSLDDLIIGLIPGGGASWGSKRYLKHWPAEQFAQLADKLAQNFGAKIIVFANETERQIAENVIGGIRQSAVSVIGKTNLREFMALISLCNIIVTNDGGPLHIAVALGINSISMFGPVDEAVYGPYPGSDKHIVMKKNVECRPCYRNFRVPECNFRHQCLNSITVEEVFCQTERMLK